MSQLQAIRGMNDILPPESALWQRLEAAVRALFQAYGYQEIRLPLVEKTELFARSIGEVTDIVEKEMYSFVDRNGDGLSLRPEGTAGCVRAGLQHGLFGRGGGVHRLWYAGAMFRHERPQKGRYRQFHQFGVEAYGLEGPDIDAEMLFMTARLWRVLGLEGVRLELNSLGDSAARAAYRETLVDYLKAHHDALDEDSRRRLETNPLRILDSKNPEMQALIEAAPRLADHIDAASRDHLEGLCARLDAAGLAYRINPRLVRGLDYYNRTVFEWVTDRLGAQGTVCAGGRYDGLVAQLGGPATPAIGFAMGIERLVALLAEDTAFVAGARVAPHAYLIAVGEAAQVAAQRLAEQLRDANPGLRLTAHCGGGGFKGQMKKADASGADYALVLGEDELARGEVALKPLRGQGGQRAVPQRALCAALSEAGADAEAGLTSASEALDGLLDGG